jgi:enoyl-CoA hydratase/carnithine racemase
VAEKLSDWFGRIEPSQFDVYSEKYKEIMLMTRRNGILEVRMHTDGGPLKFSWKVHSMWSQAWIDIGRDPENEVLILTGTGDRWLDANPEVWKKLFREWTADDKLKMYHESLRLLENLIFCIDIPTIAAINGPGTHCEIGTLCDITICTEDADFFDPHFLGGTPPGDGMALTLQRTIGIKRAAYYA